MRMACFFLPSRLTTVSLDTVTMVVLCVTKNQLAIRCIAAIISCGAQLLNFESFSLGQVLKYIVNLLATYDLVDNYWNHTVDTFLLKTTFGSVGAYYNHGIIHIHT